MMITSETIYWITRLDGLNLTLGILTGSLSIICVFGGIANSIHFAEVGKLLTPKKYIIPAILVLLFTAIIKILIPTTKEMAAILIIPKIYNSVEANKELRKLPNNLISLSNEWLEELRPKKDK